MNFPPSCYDLQYLVPATTDPGFYRLHHVNKPHRLFKTINEMKEAVPDQGPFDHGSLEDVGLLEARQVC